MSWMSWIEHQEALSFAHMSMEEMLVDCNHFCHQLFLSLWNELLMMYCSVLENVSPQEMVWSIGLYPNLFFNSTGNFSGKISLQMKNKIID